MYDIIHTHIHIHQDDEARYAYSKQPHIVAWNLNKLSEALSSLIPTKTERSQCVDNFWPQYAYSYSRIMGQRLGVEKKDIVDVLVQELLAWMRVRLCVYVCVCVCVCVCSMCMYSLFCVCECMCVCMYIYIYIYIYIHTYIHTYKQG
jgi:hypothetical protein